MNRYHFAQAIFSVLALCGCENYSNHYIDEQKSLDERYKKGEISQQEYNRALLTEKGEYPWGIKLRSKASSALILALNHPKDIPHHSNRTPTVATDV